MKTNDTRLDIIESIPVPHGEFTTAKIQLHQAYRVSDPVTVSFGKSVLAEAQLGKARLIKDLERSHSRSRKNIQAKNDTF